MAKKTRGATMGQATTRGSHAPTGRRKRRGAQSRGAKGRNRARLAGAAQEVQQQGGARRLLAEARDTAQTVGTTTIDAARGLAAGARDAAAGVAKGTRRTAGQVAGKVRENPWTALLIGSGAAWLVVDAVRGQSTGDNRSRGRRARGKSAANVASQAMSTVTKAGRSIGGQVEEFVKDNPVLAGAATLGIGLAVGMALPSTAPERAMLGDARDAIVRRASEVVRGGTRHAAADRF